MAAGDSDQEVDLTDEEDYEEEEEEEDSKFWVDWFLSCKGNEYYCDIDTEYLVDKFNLTGLSVEVVYYQQALDLLTDSIEDRLEGDMRNEIEHSAEHLYGLIHARYVLTNRGLAKMMDKYKRGDFGRCPRVFCNSQPVLPVGLSDQPRVSYVKLFCPRCEDVYNPKSGRHASLDGAYFGTSFPHMLFQVYPALLPPKSTERYVPRIFGFRIHPSATQPSQPRRHKMVDGSSTGGAGEANGAYGGQQLLQQSYAGTASSSSQPGASADQPFDVDEDEAVQHARHGRQKLAHGYGAGSVH